VICFFFGCALISGCASVAKSLGGVWFNPELAIAPNADPVADELMVKYKDQVVAYLTHLKTEEDDRPVDILENNLIEAGSHFVRFRNTYYLEVGIKRKVTYNTGQSAGLVDTPRKRAEKDFHSCALAMLKEYPHDLLQAEYAGFIIATTHAYKDLSKYKAEKTETVRFHFEHDLIKRFRDLEVSVEELLESALITVDDVRV